MATMIEPEETETPTFSFPQTARSPEFQVILGVLKFLASLKITVALFAMAIFIVFVGTLAQARADIWDVVHTYFRTAYVWIPLQVFFPKSFFPDMPAVPGSFPFLGGWSIGAMMGVNLLAAHLVRFKVQAKGARLGYGLAVIAAGCLVTWAVIRAGSGSGFQVTSLDPTMRIFWQLLQGTFAGAVLLAGSRVVFGKRAGIVVLHAGVGLMMASELLVGTSAVEAQMHIVEGETVNFVQDIRTNELAVIDTSDPAQDTVIAIPQRYLKDGATIKADDDKIRNANLLPVDIHVVKYLQNSTLEAVEPGADNPATAGIGREMLAKEAKASVGTSAGGAVDDSAAYVQIFRKGTSESLGTYLVSLLQSRLNESRERSGLSASQLRSRTGPFVLKMSAPTVIEVDGKPYRLELRFKRTYKPYSLTLNDVRHEKYLGTETPKDYSSMVHLKMDSDDPEKRVDRDNVRIWMNNPLRFNGETFYQSTVGLDPITREETTGLQVVTNAGWMIPYVSCMIVVVGLMYQFSGILLRFLRRQREVVLAVRIERKTALTAGKRTTPFDRTPALDRNRDLPGADNDSVLGALFTGGVLLSCVVAVAYMAMPPKAAEGTFDLYAAGKLPIVYEGRVKPLDTLARNTLQVMSGRDTFKDPNKKRQPAIRWLLDVIAGRKEADQYRVFRIDNIYVLDRLGLEWRDGHLYSLEELRTKADAFHEEVDQIRKKSADQLNADERKMVELDRRIRAFTTIDAAFRRPNFPPPDDQIREMARARRQTLEMRLAEEEEKLIEKAHPPLAVPMQAARGETGRFAWKPMVSAFARDYFDVQVFEERAGDPAVAAWDAILSTYLKDAPDEFNKAVRKYESLLAREMPAELESADTGFEAYYNYFSPFFVAWILYIVGFVLATSGWLGWTRTLNRTAFWLNLFTFCLHTFALLSRMYISGRPPVTNLYSSAVFIGWGCVLLGLIFEPIFRLGIGNVLSTIAGFATLFISFKLSADGDTFTVLQAVLDTQLWLATHVTCVTMGYATTFLAGTLGVLYVGAGLLTSALKPDIDKALGRMMYGTLCFAIFFSFFGTVLGGLWADDSWGRFWGWDPKENGALMIVLWNALVLHARWDGMVKNRGLAVLAVGGNIMTSWSWFGVNELGVGLHSYGFTEGVVLTLGIYVISQLVVISAGLLPKDLWASFSHREAAA